MTNAVKKHRNFKTLFFFFFILNYMNRSFVLATTHLKKFTIQFFFDFARNTSALK